MEKTADVLLTYPLTSSSWKNEEYMHTAFITPQSFFRVCTRLEAAARQLVDETFILQACTAVSFILNFCRGA